MLTTVFSITIILGLVFSESKLVRVIQYATIIDIFVFNSWNQDDLAYRRIYSSYYGLSHEPGFDFLCQICSRNKIPYEVFKTVYVAIAIVLLLLALNKLFKESGNRAYSLALLYPLLPFVELLRNLMAIAIVANSIAWYFSVREDTVLHKIIYSASILLAATFHYNALFFLVFLLTNEKKPKNSTYIQIIVLSFVSVFVCNAPFFYRLIVLIFKTDKVISWFNSTNRIGWGILIFLTFHLVSFLLYDNIYRKYYKQISNQVGGLIGDDKLSKRLYSLNVYSFTLIGLYTFNAEFFSRLYSFVILLNCFHLSCIIRKARGISIRLLSVMQVVYQIVMFMFFCRPFSEKGIMSFVLQNNYLFN